MYLIEKGSYVKFVANATVESVAAVTENIKKCIMVINSMNADMAGPMPMLHSFFMSQSLLVLLADQVLEQGVRTPGLPFDKEGAERIEPQLRLRMIQEATSIRGECTGSSLVQVEGCVAVVAGCEAHIRINRVAFGPEDTVKPMYGRKVKAEQFTAMLDEAGVTGYTVEKF